MASENPVVSVLRQHDYMTRNDLETSLTYDDDDPNIAINNAIKEGLVTVTKSPRDEMYDKFELN